MAKLVKLKSCDHQIFEVDRDTAVVSNVLSDVLSYIPDEQDSSPIPIYNVDGATLQLILQWASVHKNDAKTTNPIPTAGTLDFDANFFDVDKQILFDILMAANYLDMPQLYAEASKKIAVIIKGRTPDELRVQFKLRNDLSVAERHLLESESNLVEDVEP